MTNRELDLETLTRPGGIVPVDIEITAALVRHVLRLQAVLEEIRTTPRDDAGYCDCKLLAQEALLPRERED